MACRLDVRKAILDDIHRIFIEGRYTYYRLNENTFRIASQPETAGKSKAAFRAQAKEIAVSLRNRILKQYGTNVSIFITMPEQHWLPIELRVEPTEIYIETLFAKIKPEKRSEPVSRLAFLQDPALYQQELQEDEPLKMIPYEAWAAQNVTLFEDLSTTSEVTTNFQMELPFPPIVEVPDVMASILYQNNNCK